MIVLEHIAVINNASQPPTSATQSPLPTTANDLPNDAAPKSSYSAFILSKNATQIPAKLIAKIQTLQFVDMQELLPDDIALAETWAFTTYIAVLSQARPDLTVSCPAYMRNILQEANRIGNDGWHTYDYVFRSQVAVDS